jgi:hypothetical protein
MKETLDLTIPLANGKARIRFKGHMEGPIKIKWKEKEKK